LRTGHGVLIQSLYFVWVAASLAWNIALAVQPAPTASSFWTIHVLLLLCAVGNVLTITFLVLCVLRAAQMAVNAYRRLVWFTLLNAVFSGLQPLICLIFDGHTVGLESIVGGGNLGILGVIVHVGMSAWYASEDAHATHADES